jgi:hypothetical protein
MDGCNYHYGVWHANTFGEHIIGKDIFVNKEFLMGMHNKNKDGK